MTNQVSRTSTRAGSNSDLSNSAHFDPCKTANFGTLRTGRITGHFVPTRVARVTGESRAMPGTSTRAVTRDGTRKRE